jgi:biotin carboxyl carrier protein
METEITVPVDGKVADIYVAKGDSVNPKETLLSIRHE